MSRSPGSATRPRHSRASSNRDAWYNALVGVPYVWRGREVDGFDCYGAAVVANRLRGIELPLYTECFGGSHDEDEVARVVAGKSPAWEDVALDAVQELDVIVFDEGHGVGVAVDPGDGTGLRVITSNAKVGRSVCLPLWSSRLAHRIVSVYRYPKPSA